MATVDQITDSAVIGSNINIYSNNNYYCHPIKERLMMAIEDHEPTCPVCHLKLIFSNLRSLIKDNCEATILRFTTGRL